MQDEMLEQDVNTESSPEAIETNDQQPAVSEAPEAQDQSAQAQPKEDNVPFHLHPRFQEVISEKNALKEQLKEFQRQLEAMKQQAPKQEPQRDELMERLKQIDPVFAERFARLNKVDELESKLAQFEQWQQQQAQASVQQTVQATKDKFYAENNIPAERRELYEAQLIMAAQADPSLRTSDLPKVMKNIHDKMSKLFSSVERSTAKQLVEGKKAEAARPAPMPKGQAVKGRQENAPLSPQEAKAQLIKDTLAEIRSAKDI